MFFSVIIVNYNTKELIKNCLDSIFKNCKEGEFEVIVIDNASSDGSVEELKKIFGDKVKIISNKENKGFGKASNQGAKMAKGDYVFFLNSDTLIKNNILAELGRFLDKNNKVGIVAPKLRLDNGSEQPFAFGEYPKLFNVVFDKFLPPPKYSGYPFEADWVSGAALIMKKDLFDEVGGFDKNFFMYFEDIDLCKRVKEAGKKIIIIPYSYLTHLCGKSINRFTRRKKVYYQSQDYFYKKHYGPLVMHLMKIMRWPYRMLNIFVNIFKV